LIRGLVKELSEVGSAASAGKFAAAGGNVLSRLLSWFVLVSLSVSVGLAHEPPQTRTEAASGGTDSTLPDSPTPVTPAQDQRPPRIFWVIPTFKVTESKAPTKLTSRQKLEIVIKDTTDPYTIGFTAFTAGIAQANNEPSGYGQGAAGYGKRFGASYADQASTGFFGRFLFASLFREDPRYYRLGSGPFTHRFAHALVRPVVTHKDSGGRTFNWCGVLGSLASSGLSNAYYPEEERGVGKTFSRFATGIPFSVIDHLVDEFGPDLQQMVTPEKKAPRIAEQGAGTH